MRKIALVGIARNAQSYLGFSFLSFLGGKKSEKTCPCIPMQCFESNLLKIQVGGATGDMNVMHQTWLSDSTTCIGIPVPPETLSISMQAGRERIAIGENEIEG